MKEKTIYIVRHGETDNNACHILQGSGVDLPLNDKGLWQSKCFYETYKDIPFTKLYTSTLKRSIQSVELFIKQGIPHEACAQLVEISYGIYDGVASSSDPVGTYNKLTREWKEGKIDIKMPEGESPIEVSARIKPFVERLMSNLSDDYILICIHGRIMRILLATLFELDLVNMNLFDHSNMGLYVVKYRSPFFCIEKFNDLTHLQA
ncbi:histidine phosphatase family protein [Sporocytophaga myxococcoides]|uniref:histidine phosphatase family protein n=1 Tax=Sporocytophaga myxococcoides TaxID=153721 RepID=UPI0003FC2EA2|nr:histidine phosphatase family protein [Sporocytophaga myxococcoides]